MKDTIGWKYIALFFAFTLFSALSARGGDPGYRIEVTLAHADHDTLRLAYYFGKSQYLKDTAILEKGKFVFTGDSALAPGVYLLVVPPDNKFIHILVDEREQHFSASFDLENIVPSARFKGSKESELYYDYLRKLETRRPRAEELRKLMVEDSLQKATYETELTALNAEVKVLQDDIIRKNPASLTAMLIKANQEVPIPAFDGLAEQERKLKEFAYFKAHYFDAFDLTDPRAIRTGMIHTKVDFYMQKLTYPFADSQIVSIDYLLEKMSANREAFEYYLVYFFNEAIKSNRVGMDAVYVHLIDTYYATGRAQWVEQEQLDKMIAQANVTRPLLIGKIAPDLELFRQDGSKVAIHNIQADYIVLFFWDPECGHCKKSIPVMIDFYKTFKPRGVEIMAVCTKTGSDISSCWSSIAERGMDIWMNVTDQYLKSRYKTIYDIKTTPQIFILDKDKKIILKKISAEDLPSAMEGILKEKEKEGKG